MSPVLKNVFIVLGVLTIGYAGYYIYSQQDTLNPGGVSSDETVYFNMLANTEVFIIRSQELNEMNLDLSVLEDSRFNALKAFTRPVEDQPVGKSNPFSSAYSSSFVTGE
jgi:hypothetical protein